MILPTRSHDERSDVDPAAGILSVMMPVYNEEATVEIILDHVLARPEVGEVIAVDNGSTDRSGEILESVAARDERVRVIRLSPNRGKGGAIQRAIAEISRPYAIVQDADLEYDPRDYARLLEPLLDGHADVVYGLRGFAGATAYGFWFVIGNFLVTNFCNILNNCYIRDIETAFKLLRTDLWKQLRIGSRGFTFDPEVTTKVVRLGYRIHEVPINYYARSRAEGKKLQWQDGVIALAYLLWLRILPHRALFGTSPMDYHRKRQAELATRHPLLSRRGQTQAEAELGPSAEVAPVPADRLA